MSKLSYIISDFKVSKTTHTFIHNILGGLSENEKRFFLHLLCSHLIRLSAGEEEIVEGYDSLGLSLPSVTIKAEFDAPFPNVPLMAKKLIVGSEYIQGTAFKKGECRYYLIAPTVFQAILDHLEEQTRAPDGSPAVNLFDGTAYNVGHAMPHPADPRRPSSKLMRDAARVLHAVDCPINVDAIQKHLDHLKNTQDVAYDNDRLCAQSIFSGLKTSGAVTSYTPSYGPQDPGRIGENGGGVQSCTKRMKEAAFNGIMNIHNYDLRSSHAYVLLQELKLAGIDGSWVETHVGRGVFEQRAAHLGLEKWIYKKCFFSTINGASHVWKTGKEAPGPIQEVLLKEIGGEEAKAMFGAVVTELKPLKAIVEEWRKWLLESPNCPHHRKTQRQDYILNAAGQKLRISDEERSRKVNAHILQGQEAAYIHHLTILSKKYGFIPISNQHDGLITLGEVPEEASQEAGRLSGFQHPYLEIKPFV